MAKPSNENCANCKFCVMNETRNLECRAGPPHVQFLFMQDKQGNAKAQTFAGWGTVFADHWCGQWTPSITIAH